MVGRGITTAVDWDVVISIIVHDSFCWLPSRLDCLSSPVPSVESCLDVYTPGAYHRSQYTPSGYPKQPLRCAMQDEEARSMETTQFLVPAISCGHCKRTIVDALSPVEGVGDVEVNIPTMQVTVSHDPDRVSVDRLMQLLAEEDYPAASVERSRHPDRPVVPVVSSCSCCSAK